VEVSAKLPTLKGNNHRVKEQETPWLILHHPDREWRGETMILSPQEDLPTQDSMGKENHSTTRTRTSMDNRRTSNSYTSPATMKFALQAAAKENNQTPFSTVKTHILNKIQASYDEGFDVAKSLDEEKLVDIDQEKPKLAVSRETDPTLKAAEEENNKITLQAEMIAFLERKKALRQGMNKAYAMIYEFHCTKGMQSAIKEHPKFDSEIKNNPIELLKSIKVLMQP
jgi:hypothetical protein